MHWHTYPSEPGHTPAFCYEHAADDEPMYECWNLCVCVMCEEMLANVVFAEYAGSDPT